MEKPKYTVIARCGTFRDSQGKKHTFTRENLGKIAKNYHLSETDAPLVIGHEHNDSAPAYGWVDTLFMDNDKLCATFSYVNEEVKNLVYKGAYRNISMSVDMENLRLLHVALLGTAAPAIDGLGAINLNAQEGVYVFASQNFNEGTAMNEEELKKKITELEQQLAELQASLQKMQTEKESAEKTASEVQAEFSAYKEKQANEERKQRVERLVADGKLAPAKKDEIYAFASQLAKNPADFSYGTDTISMEEKYFRELESREPMEMFADFSHKPAHNQDGMNTAFDPNTITSKL